MFKKTKGYVLLTLLVLTGFAGQIENKTLSTQERRYLLQSLKETRKELMLSVKELSDQQLNYKSVSYNKSILESLAELNAAETIIWNKIQAVLHDKNDNEAAQSSELEDAEIRQLVNAEGYLKLNSHAISSITGDANYYLKEFKEERSQVLKYVRTTTEDLREYVTVTPYGNIDIYQLLLLISYESERMAAQVVTIKAEPLFPAD